MSSYTEGQIHQLADALERAEFTPRDITNLGQFSDLYRLRALVRGELVISAFIRDWREQDGVIYLSVTSNGMTGPEWEKWFDEHKYNLSPRARFLLNSPDFKPTKGVTYEIAILKGMLFEDEDRITRNIRFRAKNGTLAQGRKLFTPNAEIMCLIRRRFSDKELEAMGLIWIVTMHEPIKDSGGDLDLLSANRHDGGRLDVCCDHPGRRWNRGSGFAFVVS